MEDLFKYIPSFQNITTVISLVAFIIAVVLSFLFNSIRVKVSQQRKTIELAKESDRPSLIQQTLDKWGIDGQNLSNKQKFEFIMKYDSRKERRFYFATIISLLFLILSGILISNTLQNFHNSSIKQPANFDTLIPSVIPSIINETDIKARSTSKPTKPDYLHELKVIEDLIDYQQYPSAYREYLKLYDSLPLNLKNSINTPDLLKAEEKYRLGRWQEAALLMKENFKNIIGK